MRVEYSEDFKHAYFNGVRFRRDNKTGYYLAGKKTYMGKRERLHCYVWRFYNGAIPEGHHIHHSNGDKTHNDIENLVCIKTFDHLSLHGKEYAEKHYGKLIKNLNENARPKASEWHRSPEGREWHQIHGIETAKNLKERKYTCQYCGKVFYKKPLGAIKFCSNNCKSAQRRKDGVDDEIRRCAYCGCEFKANKYSRKKFCSYLCAGSIHKRSGSRAGIQHGS